MAHLHTQATRNKPAERYDLKWNLTRRLYEQGYNKKDIRLLFRFIDWLLALPPELTEKFTQELIEYEEEQKMRYVTQTEALLIKDRLDHKYKEGREEGREEGRQAMLETLYQILIIRFEVVLGGFDERFEPLDLESLKELSEVALTAQTLIEFENALAEMISKVNTTSPLSDNGGEQEK